MKHNVTGSNTPYLRQLLDNACIAAASVLLCSFGSVMAVANDTREFQDKLLPLVQIAFLEPPSSMDVVMVTKETRSPMSEGEIRNAVRQVYQSIEVPSSPNKRTPKGDKALRQRETHAEVRRLLAEQGKARIRKRRIRYNGVLFRVDEILAEPGKTIPENAPYERTYVNTGDPTKGDFACFEYDHKARLAKTHDQKGFQFTRIPVWNIVGMDDVASVVIKAAVGRVNDGLSSFEVDADKLNNLLSDSSDQLLVRFDTSPLKIEGESLERLSVLGRQDPQPLLMEIDYNVNDLRLYQSQLFNPTTGARARVIQKESYGPEGIPRVYKSREWLGDDRRELVEESTITHIEINPRLPRNLFTFDPPSDYRMIDYRPSVPVMTASDGKVLNKEQLTQAGVKPPSARFHPAKWFLMANLGLVGSFVCWFCYHRRR